MSVNIPETFELLFDKNNNAAYAALQALQKESDETDSVYRYMDRLGDMLETDHSYIRARALILIACNAKWDKDNRIDELIDRYLKHITDSKPITAIQCVRMLPLIAQHKPDLRQSILLALRNADISFYPDAMRPLVYKEIQNSLKKIDSGK